MDGCTSYVDERDCLYTSGVVERNNSYGIYATRIMFNVKCLKQHDLDV